jgi:protein CpxP
MKQWMMTAALALLTTAGAHAQEKKERSPQERATMQTERMVKELGLDAAQAAKVDAMNRKYAEQAEVLRKEREAQRATMMKKGKDIREARETELKGVLDPEQFAKWQAQREAMEQKRQEKRKEMQKQMRGDRVY